MELYPLRFKSILKSALWGGTNLIRKRGRDFPREKVAESWDLADLGENVSVVANGPLSGKSLRELLDENAAAILGKAAPPPGQPNRFPLLVKLLDAEDQLSLQVHPDDAYAAANENGQRGKNEMWYLLQTREGARLTCGFKRGATLSEYRQALANHSFDNIVETYPTAPGDAFFVPAGTIHAVGKGNLLIEIQVPSELTYRIHDWGRMDADGKPRATHPEKAEAVLRFEHPEAGRLTPQPLKETMNSKREKLVQCGDFSVEKWTLVGSTLDPHAEEKPAVYFVLQGSGEFLYGENFGKRESFRILDTFLVPAALGPLRLIPKGNLPILLLRAIPG